MEQDELLKRVLMMQRLQGMETEPISAEDPYASMEKDQLIDDATSAGDGNGTNLCGRSIRFYGKRPADINDTLPC